MTDKEIEEIVRDYCGNLYNKEEEEEFEDFLDYLVETGKVEIND